MGITKTIREKEQRLAAVEAEAITLRDEIDVLRKAKAVMQGKRIAEASNEPPTRRRGRPPGMKAGALAPGSMIGQAVRLLREAGEAKHIDWLISELHAQGIEAKKQSLVSSLAKLAKVSRIVCRASGPSTFGLREWDLELPNREGGNDVAVLRVTH